MTTSDLSAIASDLTGDEGSIAWPYRDSTQGNATVGVGHLIPDLAAAQLLPFIPPMMQEDWTNLMSAPVGMTAGNYEHFTECRLRPADITALLESDIQARIPSMMALFPAFDGFPSSAKVALFNMLYNLGSSGLSKFVKLVNVAKVGDWARCAAQCHRIGVSEARNAKTARQFMEAAQPDA